jgi:hypothetical protein
VGWYEATYNPTGKSGPTVAKVEMPEQYEGFFNFAL